MQSWLERWNEVENVHKQQGWPQAWEYCQAKPIQTLERASQGVNWSWSQESPRSDIFRKRATKPLLNQRHRQKHLTWAKEQMNWTVAQCSKVLFSDESKCWRVERHRIHVAWSPVWSFHSQWWFGLPCHLLVLVHCEVHSQHSHLPGHLEHFILPSADKLYGDADFIFQQDLAPVHTVRGTKSWFNDHSVTVLDWPANSPDLNPIENLDERHQTQQCRWPEDRYQSNLGFITPEQCHRLIDSMPRRIDAVIHAKGGPTKYWVHRNEHTFQKPDISV